MSRTPPFKIEITLGPDLVDALDAAMQRAVTRLIEALRHAERARHVEPAQAEAGSKAEPNLLNRAEVLEMIGVGNSTLKRMITDGRFPSGRYITANRIVWYKDDVVRWLDALTRERRQQSQAQK